MPAIPTGIKLRIQRRGVGGATPPITMPVYLMWGVNAIQWGTDKIYYGRK